MAIRIFAIILILLGRNCSKVEELALKKSSYSGTELNTQGYYFCERPDEDAVELILLYRDGTIFNFSLMLESKVDLGKIEKDFLRSNDFIKDVKKQPWELGLFQIKSRSIEYEVWKPTGGPGAKIIAVKYFGDILNDTTFVVNRYYARYNEEEKQVNCTFHFRHFSPKPDSTNTFIK